MTVIKTAKNLIIPAGLALCVGALVAGCSSTKAQTRETTTTTHTTMSQPVAVTEPSGAPMEAMQEAVIPLHQETMRVGKQSVDSGEVHLRKVVITEKTSQPVELRKETLEIVREPAGASTATTATDTKLFEGQEIVIKLKEEQPVVEKQVIQTGSIVAKKGSQAEQRTVSGDLRREDIQVDRTGSGANVTFKGGSINEASGAQQPQAQPQPQPQEQKPAPAQP